MSKFLPNKLTYLEMEKVPKKDGQLFFTTDTKEIFLDVGEENVNRLKINTIPTASETVLGGVKIDGVSIKIDKQNVIYTEVFSEWKSEKDYVPGDIVLYKRNIFKCINGVVAETSNIFNPNDWELLSTGIRPWEQTTFYKMEEIIFQDDSLYICINSHTSGTDFEYDKTLYWKTLIGQKGDKGLSAYEVALKNGFLGSELDWINSLQGEPGISLIKTEKQDILISLSKDNWIGGSPIYYQRIENELITQDLNPRIDVVISTNQSLGLLEQENFSFITRAETSDGYITFYCYAEKPVIDLTIIMEVF